ncbi:MAG: hypothetical protein ABIT05_06410 [Chitinophagaceae bacterium]
MKLLSPIIGKKIIAGLLLALFVFIHAEKVFHIHEKNAVASCHEGIALQSNSNSCSICDFQLSKDSELPLVAAITVSFTFLQNKPVFFSSSCSYGSAANLPGRGPPVI